MGEDDGTPDGALETATTGEDDGDELGVDVASLARIGSSVKSGSTATGADDGWLDGELESAVTGADDG